MNRIAAVDGLFHIDLFGGMSVVGPKRHLVRRSVMSAIGAKATHPDPKSKIGDWIAA